MSVKLPTSVLGRTGIPVTRLGYGTAMREPVSDDTWGAILNRVLDHGINFVDTANVYGPAEEQIGRHIADRRSEYYLATKWGWPPWDSEWTRANLVQGVHESLQRLRTDYVDVMMLHNPPEKELESGQVVRALEQVRAEGKTRWIGVSTTLPELQTYVEWNIFDVIQISYSALEREQENWLPVMDDAGIGIVVRGGVAQGEPEEGRGTAERWDAFDLARLKELQPSGETRTSFMLRYTLSNLHVHTTIVGTSNLDHLEANLAAALRGPLPDDVCEAVRERLANQSGDSTE